MSAKRVLVALNLGLVLLMCSSVLADSPGSLDGGPKPGFYRGRTWDIVGGPSSPPSSFPAAPARAYGIPGSAPAVAPSSARQMEIGRVSATRPSPKPMVLLRPETPSLNGRTPGTRFELPDQRRPPQLESMDASRWKSVTVNGVTVQKRYTDSSALQWIESPRDDSAKRYQPGKAELPSRTGNLGGIKGDAVSRHLAMAPGLSLIGAQPQDQTKSVRAPQAQVPLAGTYDFRRQFGLPAPSAPARTPLTADNSVRFGEGHNTRYHPQRVKPVLCPAFPQRHWWLAWYWPYNCFGFSWHDDNWSISLSECWPASCWSCRPASCRHQPVWCGCMWPLWYGPVETVYVERPVIERRVVYEPTPSAMLLNTYDEIDRIIDALKYGAVGERKMAARELGLLGTQRALFPLVYALEYDPDATVRYFAAKSLGQLGYREALPALRKSVQNDPDEIVRSEAQESVDRILTGR